MKRVLTWLALPLGLVVGGLSALAMSGLIGPKGQFGSANIVVEGWATDWDIGSPSASAYTRARVAKHGLLALAKSEAIYFTRRLDEAGNPLRADCRYKLSGEGQDALWWSITLYDQDSRLPVNVDEALSIDATQVGETERWTVLVSSDPPESGLWLSSRGSETFDLTLRLYQPSPEILASPDTALRAPRLQKIDCEAAS